MEEIIILSKPTAISFLKEKAQSQFVYFTKAVVDVENKIIAIGGSLHADEEKTLLAQGSLQQNLWGINIYFDVAQEDRIEFDSMINLRPYQGNKSRSVDNIDIQKEIISITNQLIIF